MKEGERQQHHMHGLQGNDASDILHGSRIEGEISLHGICSY